MAQVLIVHSTGGLVAVHLEGDATRRWLKRNTTHYVQIILPRRPGEGVFRVKRNR